MQPDYLVSSETGYPDIMDHIRCAAKHNGVYIGTGPEQNYTYMAAARPSWAFIVDVRRENQVLHYLFKSIFEMADTRQEYLSLLFSKPLVDRDGYNLHSMDQLVDYFDRTNGDTQFYKDNLSCILENIQRYRLPSWTENDRHLIEGIYAQFFLNHLHLQCRPDIAAHHPWPYPTFRDILLAKNKDGQYQHFLNDDSAFLRVKNLHQRNRIIPIQGDFSGSKTLSALASFIKDRKKTVSLFYVSNVEYHLLRQGTFDAFVSNLKLLPVSAQGLLIRAFRNMPDRMHPHGEGNQFFTSVAQTILSFLVLYDRGLYRTYWDIGTLDYIR